MRAPGALALAGLLAAATPGSSAVPDGGTAVPDGGVRPAGRGTELAIVVVRAGSVTRVRLDGEQLRASDAAGRTVVVRLVGAADRARLFEAARHAAADRRPQGRCPHDELFLSVTVDEATTSAAVCPRGNLPSADTARWQALLDLVRELLGGPR